jgi:putative transposase
MGKLSLSVGSKVYYKNIEHIILRAVNFKTLSIAPVDNQEKISNVDIKDLSSVPTVNCVQLDHYSDEEWNEAKRKYEAIEHLVFRQRTREEVEDVATLYSATAMTVYRWIKAYEESEKISSLISNKHRRGEKGVVWTPWQIKLSKM